MARMMVAVLVMALVGPVWADTYQWTDEQGVVHFTDNPGGVPAKFRGKAIVRESLGSEQPAAPPAAPAIESSAGQAGQKMYGGKTEEWWRERFMALRQEQVTLQNELPAMRDALEQLRRYSVVSLGRPPMEGELAAERYLNDPQNPSANIPLNTIEDQRRAYQVLKSRVEQGEQRLQGLNEALRNLDLEASRAAVPLEARQ